MLGDVILFARASIHDSRIVRCSVILVRRCSPREVWLSVDRLIGLLLKTAETLRESVSLELS